MADTIKPSEELSIDCYFVDGDTRNFKIANPKSSITSAEIESLNTFMQANNILVGDKAGATFGRITKATRITKAETTLDISQTPYRKHGRIEIKNPHIGTRADKGVFDLVSVQARRKKHPPRSHAYQISRRLILPFYVSNKLPNVQTTLSNVPFYPNQQSHIRD